jgi:hypothetical protein
MYCTIFVSKSTYIKRKPVQNVKDIPLQRGIRTKLTLSVLPFQSWFLHALLTFKSISLRHNVTLSCPILS